MRRALAGLTVALLIGPSIGACSRSSDDPATQANAPELCDGLDNDCNGVVDDAGRVQGVGASCTTEFPGVCAAGQYACPAPVNGVTALACKRPYPVYLDETAGVFDVISISAGMRGLQVLLAPGDYIRATGAVVAPIARDKG